MRPILRPLIAFALLTPLAAHAQSDERPMPTDSYDKGDWWWLDTSGNGPRGTLLMVDGEGVRTGDTVRMRSFVVYRQPNDAGVVGARIDSVVDCAAKTDTASTRALFYTQWRMKALPAGDSAPKPLDERTVYYHFACTSDREHTVHLGRGSRRGFAEQIFAKYPAP